MLSAMESRRDRFRRQLARLAGTGNPREAIDAGLYVSRPASSERLVRRVELQPNATRVLVGPLGSGKSTELLVLADALNHVPEFWAAAVDVSLVHNLSNLHEGSLIAAAGVYIQEELKIDNAAFRRLREVAYGATESTAGLTLKALSVTLGGPAFGKKSAPSGGLLEEPNNRSGVAQTLAPLLLDAIHKAQEAQGLHPVLLFDSLDRYKDLSNFRTVLENDARALVENGFGVILTAPVDLLWLDSGELRALTETWDILLYEDPADDPKAQAFLLEVLRRRVDPDLLPEMIWLSLVRASGGVIRDLIELARKAVEEAYLEGRDIVGQAEVDAAIAHFARALALGLDGMAISTLRSVQATRQVRAFDEQTLRLLKNRQILEHRNASGSYFEPHPTLESLLQRWAEAS